MVEVGRTRSKMRPLERWQLGSTGQRPRVPGLNSPFLTPLPFQSTKSIRIVFMIRQICRLEQGRLTQERAPAGSPWLGSAVVRPKTIKMTPFLFTLDAPSPPGLAAPNGL